MPLVLSDIRRPTFTICACVTSEIAKSFLFDRRSDLLSFRLVARPPPTSRALAAPYDQQNMAFTVQPRFLLVDPSGISIVLAASQRPFPDLRTVHICWLDEPCFFHHHFFFCILQSGLPGSQRKFVALPICLKPPHMNPFQPVSNGRNWWGMNTEVILVALLSWDICNHLPIIMRGLGPSTFSSPNSHCQDQILHLLTHQKTEKQWERERKQNSKKLAVFVHPQWYTNQASKNRPLQQCSVILACDMRCERWEPWLG